MKIACRNCGQDVREAQGKACAACGTTLAHVRLQASAGDGLSPGARADLWLRLDNDRDQRLTDLTVEVVDSGQLFMAGSELRRSLPKIDVGKDWVGKLWGAVRPDARGKNRLDVRLRYRDARGGEWVFRGEWLVPCSPSPGASARAGGGSRSPAAVDAGSGNLDPYRTVEMGEDPADLLAGTTSLWGDDIVLLLEEVHETGAHRATAERVPSPPETVGDGAPTTDPMDCPVCAEHNVAGRTHCVACRQPLDLGDLTGFSLLKAGGNAGTNKYLERVSGMVRDLGRTVRAPSEQVPGRDEARLHRVLSRLAAELDEGEFGLLLRGVASRLCVLPPGGRGVVSRAVQGVIRGVCGQVRGECSARPVRLHVEFEPGVGDVLSLLTLHVERPPEHPISMVDIEIPTSRKLARVIKVVPPEEGTSLSLAERLDASLDFQVELHASGEARMPVRVRLSCLEGDEDSHCTCGYQGTFLWKVGVDERNQTVVKQMQVIEPDTSIVKVYFGDDDERPTLDGDEDEPPPSRVRFELPLSIDVPELVARSDAHYGSTPALAPAGGTPIRAGHFLVRAGQRRRILFVLLDPVLTLGRSQTNHVVTRYGGLGDEGDWVFVSRRHADLAWRGDAEGAVLTDGYNDESTNPTQVKRQHIEYDLRLQSMRVVHGDELHIPPLGGDVKHPYVLELRTAHRWAPREEKTERRVERRAARKWDQRVIGHALAPAPDVHVPLGHERPFIYAWLPGPSHEALVGFHTDLGARLPGPGPDELFRLLRDDRGFLFVSPCSGVTLTLTRGQITHTLRTHAHYYLANADVLRCGETSLTFKVHPHVGDEPPDLGRRYKGKRGPFDPPDDFRAMLLTLMVRNPA